MTRRTKRRQVPIEALALAALCGFVAGALTISTIVWAYGEMAGRQAGEMAATHARSTPEATTEGASGDGRPDAPAPTATIGAAPGSPAGLEERDLQIPVEGVRADDLVRSFTDRRGTTRQHEALDILAPRNTPVLAADDGSIVRLFYSRAGGTTVYQFDPSGQYCYYYAHLERYASGLREGQPVAKGQLLGYVGTSGNAPDNAPHLHFAIFRLTEARHWWEGTPIDPYDVLKH